MTKQRIKKMLLLAGVTVVIAACGEQSSGDHCDNHYELHANHLDSVATLSVELSESGTLESRLLIPSSVFGDLARADIEILLANTENTFTVQSTTACSSPNTSLNWTNDVLEVRSASDCGADNRVEKINIALFDHVAGLEEIVASVTTAATAKRFAISRKCDAPIFRLDRP